MRLPGAAWRSQPHPVQRSRAVLAALLAGLALALCLPTALAGASSTTTSSVPTVIRQGGSVTVGIDQAPTGCNPNTPTGNTWADRLVLGAVLPSAFVVEPNGQSTLDQAVVEQAELISTSPQTIEYTINPRAEWADGAPITAADFIYAWQSQRGAPSAFPGTPPPLSQAASTLGYRDIASVKGSNNNRTVTVVFKTPYADWQQLFSYLLPAHVLAHTGWDPACTSVDPAVDVSGGPFEIASVVPGHQVTLVRNPHWWGVAPYLDQIVVRTASSADELAQWLSSGQAQVVEPTSFPQRFVESVSALGGTTIKLDMGTSILDLQFATASSSMASARVRLAVANAIDRTRLVNATVSWADKHLAPANSHFYAQGQNNYPDLPPGEKQAFAVRPNLNATARQLRAAGYVRGAKGLWRGPNGKDLVLRLAVDDADQWARQDGLMIAQQLRRAGIAVLVVGTPSAAAAGLRLAGGGADLALLPIHTGVYPTEAIAWDTLSLGSPGQNGSQDWSHLDNNALTTGLLHASQELNPVTAQPLYQQADQQLWTLMSNLPLYTEPAVVAWSSKVSGVQLNPYDAGLLWYAQSWGLLVPQSTTTTTTAPHG